MRNLPGHKTLHLSKHTVFLLVVLLPIGMARGGTSEATAIRLKACAATQPDYDRIAAAWKDDPGIRAYRVRLEKLDSTASSVLQDLGLYHDTFLQNSLATVGGAKSTAGQGAKRKPIGAAAIFTGAATEWNERLPLPPAKDADRQVLVAYYDAGFLALKQVILARAQRCLGVGDTGEVVRLAFVFPLLGTGEADWTASSADSLPAWMSRPDAIRAMEDLALHARRPRTAYQMHLRLKLPATKPADESSFARYVREASDALCRAKDYPAAISCLDTAIRAGDSTHDGAATLDLRFRLAEIRSGTGDPDAAAEEVKKVLSLTADPDVHGRAALLRLKYLYEAKHFPQASAEAGSFKKDPNCASYLPQILYIAWVADRQSGSDGVEKQWRDEFLARFPDHPLGADMYFASAMNSLAAGEYDESLRLLEFIEHRYPQAGIIEQVHELKQRLSSAQAAKASGTPAAKPVK